MRVARVEAVGDAPFGLVEHDLLAPDRPLTGEGPVVDAQAFGKLVARRSSNAPSAEAKRSLRPEPRYVSGVRRLFQSASASTPSPSTETGSRSTPSSRWMTRSDSS